MTALNWDKDRAKRQTKEHSFDDLPPVGSYRDQLRCGARPWSNSNRNNHASSASQVHVRNRWNDFDQLNRYLQHAMHPDFKRKAACQKAEIIQILKKLIIRCETWGKDTTIGDKSMLLKARNAVKDLCH